MTKAQLRDLVKDYLAGGACPPELKGRYHPVVIERYIEMVYNDVVADSLTKYGDDSILDGASKPYEVAVNLDLSRKKYYSVIPISIVQLPGNIGIRQICPLEDESNSFVPIPLDSMPVFSELEVSQVDETTAYKLEGNKVFYEWFNPDITTVLMKLVPPFHELLNTDPVAIPAGKNALIFDWIVKMLRSKPPQDNINDNNAIQV